MENNKKTKKEKGKFSSFKEYILNNKFKSLLMLVLLMMVLGTGAKEMTNLIGPDKTISFKETMEYVNKGEVKKIFYVKSKDNMTVQLKNGETKITKNPESDSFKREMLEKGIDVTAKEKANLSNYVNLVILLLIFFYIVKTLKGRKNGNPGFLNSKSKPVSKSNVNFDSIAGNKEAKEEMKLLLKTITEKEKYKEMGIRPQKGVILFGPPGTGKTLLAKALANEADIPFFYASSSDFIELFAGSGPRKVRKIFEEAAKASPAILFIDEIDGVGGKRSNVGRNSEDDKTLNAILEQMDGFVENKDLIVIAATNRLDSLDPALIRPGRFDKHIYVGLPEVSARKEIIELYLKGKNFQKMFLLNRLLVLL